jgi:spermidine synthase
MVKRRQEREKPIIAAAKPARATRVYVLAAWCGAASLLSELVWSRYLHLVFGVSAYAVATVLACFMLGLAAGNAVLGRLLARGARPTRVLLVLLAVLGVYTAAFPFLYELLPPVMRALSADPPPPADTARALLLRGCLAIVTLMVPTFCVGGTFPALVAWADKLRGQSGPAVARVYGYNTLGGVAGTLLAGMMILPAMGMRGSLWIAAGMNLLGAGVVLLSMRGAAPETEKKEGANSVAAPAAGPADVASPKLPWIALGIAGVSGLTSLAYQVLWTRLLTLFFRDTVYDFTIVLAVFLMGIVLGSLACERLLKRQTLAAHALGWTQLAIAAAVFLGLHLSYRLPWWLNDLQTNKAVLENYGERFWAAAMGIRLGYALFALAPITVLFGAAFPLATRVWAGRAGASAKPGHVGAVTAVNVSCAAAGAILGGFVLVPLLYIQGSFMALATLNALSGVVMLWTLWKKNRGFLAAGTVAGLLLLMASAPAWDRLRMSTGFLDQNQPLHELLDLQYYREDAAGITSVVELVPYRQKYLVTNRLYAQNTSDLGGLQDHRRLGHLPMLLHPKPRTVLAVGLGAGITLRGIVDLGPQRADVVELSRGVVEAAAKFSGENGRVLEDERVRIFIQDGRNYLTTTGEGRGTYDVIVLDILHPMSSGSSTVFSREYYELCRGHLAAGGLVCQWLPVHQLSEESLRTIVRTFRSVFPHTTVWYGLIGDSTQVVGLVGTQEPAAVDAAALVGRYSRAGERLRQSLGDVNLGTPEQVLSHFVMGEAAAGRFAGEGVIDTDDRPRIEFEAPRLAATAARQGKVNLLALAGAAEPVAAVLPPDAGEVDRAALERAVAGKRAIIETMRWDVDGKPEARTAALREALARDPGNVDLREVVPREGL